MKKTEYQSQIIKFTKVNPQNLLQASSDERIKVNSYKKGGVFTLGDDNEGTEEEGE